MFSVCNLCSVAAQFISLSPIPKKDIFLSPNGFFSLIVPIEPLLEWALKKEIGFNYTVFLLAVSFIYLHYGGEFVTYLDEGILSIQPF